MRYWVTRERGAFDILYIPYPLLHGGTEEGPAMGTGGQGDIHYGIDTLRDFPEVPVCPGLLPGFFCLRVVLAL